MTLDNINTKDFLFNPKDSDFEQKMIDRSDIFDIKSDRSKWLTYICLVYDTSSELRRNTRDYNSRKAEAAKIAGFEMTDGIFNKYVEDILLGEDLEFNKAVIEYVYLMFSNDYKLLYVLTEKFDQAMREQSMHIKTLDEKERKNLTGMKEQIEELENKLFGGTEVINMRKALYLGVDNAKSKMPRKEEEIKEFERNGLELWNPYGKNYKPEKIRFLGDDVNNVTQKT